MAIYKSFRVLFVSNLSDPLGSIVADLGRYRLPIVQGVHRDTTNHVWTLPGQLPALGLFAEELPSNSSCILFNQGASTISNVHLAELTNIITGINYIEHIPSSSTYLVFYNDSGAYAYVAAPIPYSEGSSAGGVLSAYGKNGNSLGTVNLEYQWIFFSINDSINRVTSFGAIVADHSDGIITDLEFRLAGDTGNQYSNARVMLTYIGGTQYKQNTIDFLNDCIDEVQPATDPYNNYGESEEGGGEGDADDEQDDIDIPELPPDYASDSKFITLYNPTLTELQNLASYMWSSAFDINTFKKLFANPMDCILGLSLVPVEVPNGGTKTVTVGNISTGITMQTAASQFVEVDCGTLNVKEFWGAYLDYEPYTKAEIYLPYIGIHAISVDDIMDKAVNVVYHVDILSGACVAYIKCDDTILYQFIGSCSAHIPVTGNDYASMISGVISIAGSIGSMVATGGASAPLAATAIASTAVNSMKPNIEKSGSLSGAGGLMSVQTPYLILTRPRLCVPGEQNTYLGYPAFITVTMGDLSGYTEVEAVHLENMSATVNEVTEIENMLKNGVIF